MFFDITGVQAQSTSLLSVKYTLVRWHWLSACFMQIHFAMPEIYKLKKLMFVGTPLCCLGGSCELFLRKIPRDDRHLPYAYLCLHQVPYAL